MTLFKNILSTILIAGIFALHPSLNKGENPITYIQHFVYGNSLNISTNSSIQKELIEIKWLCENQNVSCKDLIIYKHGKQINDIPSEKGSQKLVVFYKKKKIGEISQHKKIKKQAHRYNVELLAENNSLFFNGEITGPSPHKEKRAATLSNASL